MNLQSLPLAFIVCRGRSGSTLLQSILDAHPEICAPIESKFILHLATRYKDETHWNKDTRHKFCRDLYSNRKFRLFWKVTKTDLWQEFEKHQINSFEDACKVVLLSYPSVFKKTAIRLIIDKNPPHSRYLDQLNQLFPKAKFIYLQREPKAVVSSQTRAFHNHRYAILSWEWVILNQRLLSFQQEHPKRVLPIHYEEMVQKPQTIFSEIFNFLGMDYRPELLKSYRVREKTIAQDSYLNLPHHRNIAQPIQQKNIEKWRNRLSDSTVKLIENITAPLAQELGYAFEKPSVNLGQQLRIFWGQIAAKTIHLNFRLLFQLPFTIRRLLYDLVSLFFDQKYKNS